MESTSSLNWRRLGVRLAGSASVAALLLFLAGPARAQGPSPDAAGPYPTLEITNAIVIDGSGAPPWGPNNILIQGNRIISITPAGGRGGRGGAPAPTPDRVIDAHGGYVMPGIIDMHTHMSALAPKPYIYRLWLGMGITSVRVFNVGNDTPAQMVQEKKADTGTAVAPRLFVYPIYGGNSPAAASPEGARATVTQWHALGVDGVKVLSTPGLYPPVLRALADQARNYGMGMAVHIAQNGVYPMNAVEVAAAGVSSIEHHYGYAEAAFSDKTIQNLPDDYNYSDEQSRFLWTGQVWLQTDVDKLHKVVIPELLDIAKKTGFTMDPTMVVYEANRDVSRIQTLPWHDQYDLPVMMDFWRPSPAHHGSYFYNWTSNDEAIWAQVYDRWMAFVNDYKNQGGRVSVGSDVGSIYDTWGFGTIREMELLEQAGFNPLETIHSATQVGAEDLGLKDLGLVRPGYLADLVVLSESPIKNLKVLYGNGIDVYDSTGKPTHITAVQYTIRDGVVFDSQRLLAEVRDIVVKAKAASPQPTPTSDPGMPDEIH